MNENLTFYDLYTACKNGCKKLAKAIARVLRWMICKTLRYWWIMLISLLASVGCVAYQLHNKKAMYNAEATLLFYGLNQELFQQTLVPTMEANGLDGSFKYYDIIDIFNDSLPDLTDHSGVYSRLDRNTRHMNDRVCVVFTTSNPDAPAMLRQIIDLVNEDPYCQENFAVCRRTLEQEAAALHRQADNLGDIFDEYYAERITTDAKTKQPRMHHRNTIDLGTAAISHLFFTMGYVDQKLVHATAPVVIDGGIVAYRSNPTHRISLILETLIAAWLIAIVIGLLIEYRKQIIAWMKK